MGRIKITPDRHEMAGRSTTALAEIILLGDPLAAAATQEGHYLSVNLKADRSTWDAEILEFSDPVTPLTARAVAAIALGPRPKGPGGRYARREHEPPRFVQVMPKLEPQAPSATLRAALRAELARRAIEGAREIAAALDARGHGTLGAELVGQAKATWGVP